MIELTFVSAAITPSRPFCNSAMINSPFLFHNEMAFNVYYTEIHVIMKPYNLVWLLITNNKVDII